MPQDRFGRGGPLGKLAIVLASGAMGLFGAAHATPPKDGGCGSCGGGSESTISRQEAAESAGKAAKRGTEDTGGVTVGSGGRRSEALGGSIAQLGEAEEANEFARQADKLGLTGERRANFIDLMSNPITRAMLEVEIEDALATNHQAQPPPAPVPPPPVDAHSQRGGSLDMLTILNRATNKAAGRGQGLLPVDVPTDDHDARILAAQAGHAVQGLVGSSSPSSQPSTPPRPSAPPAGARTPPASVIMADSPSTPINSPPLGDTTISPTAIPPRSGWVDLPPDPSIAGLSPATAAPPAAAPPPEPPPPEPEEPAADPVPVTASPPPASPPPQDELDEWIRQNEERQRDVDVM